MKPPPWIKSLRAKPLRTRRLVIRPIAPGDDAHIHPAVKESLEHLSFWLPWATPGYRRADTKAFVRASMRAFERGEDFALLMFTKKGELVGGTGLHPRGGRDAPHFEIGYWVRTSAASRGYATEAVKALLRYGLRKDRTHRIEIRCDPRNAASLRVIKKCGLEKEGLLRQVARGANGRFIDLYVFSKLR